MPIYDYQCQECDKVSEIFIRRTDKKDISCPNCGSKNLSRLISASYMIKMNASAPGFTCCGRTERCDTPLCSTGDTSRVHNTPESNPAQKE